MELLSPSPFYNNAYPGEECKPVDPLSRSLRLLKTNFQTRNTPAALRFSADLRTWEQSLSIGGATATAAAAAAATPRGREQPLGVGGGPGRVLFVLVLRQQQQHRLRCAHVGAGIQQQHQRQGCRRRQAGGGGQGQEAATAATLVFLGTARCTKQEQGIKWSNHSSKRLPIFPFGKTGSVRRALGYWIWQAFFFTSQFLISCWKGDS